MPIPDLDGLLERAAELHGVVPGYWDISGVWHPTTPAQRAAILSSLGLPCGDAAALRATLDADHSAAEARLTDPALVVGIGDQPAALTVRAESGEAELEVALEDGTRTSHSELCMDRAVALPVLPLGYHMVRVRVGTRESATRVIVCPEKAWLPGWAARGERRAGLAVSLFGVRGAHTWGCGDFTSLRTLIDWAAREAGATYLALNPLHAIHNRQPYNTSPYLPNSTYYRNPIYLDVDRVEDMRHSLTARTLRAHSSTLAEIEALNKSEFVEYERVARLKSRFLRLLWDRFRREELAENTPRARAFLDWVDSEGDLLDRYATYMALDEYLHAQDPAVWIWPDWPEAYRDPDSPAVRGFRREHESVVRMHQYIQWQLDLQAAETQAHALAAGMELGLFHDLPLATDRCGSDLWAHRRFFVHGCRVGSPPDAFSPKGQDWSFPPPDKRAHRDDGYRLFAESIRKSARHGGALRLDHVMRLFRLYWIPEGFDATEGSYVLDWHEDLLRVLALESHRNRVLIVGEDLGTVEPAMRDALDRFGILSYRLFYFEKDASGAMLPASRYPRQALVSSTTHDLPTLAGFWSGADIETRRRLGLIQDEASYRSELWSRTEDKRRMFDALMAAGLLPKGYPRAAADGPELSGELHNAITGFLASTPSLLMTLNQEDLTKETEQQNLPGTTWQYPNWRRKMRFSLEDLESPRVRDYTAMFKHWIDAEGRAPAPASGASSEPADN